MQGDQSMGLIIPRSWLPSDAGSSSMVSDSVLELLTTSALALEEPVLSAAGTERTFAKSTLLVKPMPPPRTLTWGSGAGATPVDMAMPELRSLLAHAILRAPAGQPTLVVR
jgi:hypothetical protein